MALDMRVFSYKMREFRKDRPFLSINRGLSNMQECWKMLPGNPVPGL